MLHQKHVIGTAKVKDPRLSLVAINLKGLQLVTGINAKFDLLLRDGEMLASKLNDAGVKGYRKVYSGVA